MKLFFCCLVVFSLLFVASSLTQDPIQTKPEREKFIIDSLNTILSESTSLTQAWNDISNVMLKISPFLQQIISSKSPAEANYDYYRCLPAHLTTLAVPQNSKQPLSSTWSTPCFNNVTAQVSLDDLGLTITVDLSLSDPVSDSCKDFYAFGTIGSLSLQNLGEGTSRYSLELLTRPEAEHFDAKTNGIRVFLFPVDPEATMANLALTATLFEPMLKGPAVAPEIAAENVQFLEYYANFWFPERPTQTQVVAINESLIHSGDFFAITRLDGLDPMIGWGMGGTTGHTALALWFDGVLYICESTVKSAYWPTDGIQRTPYAQWIEQAQAADFLVDWVPLNAEKRAAFNETAANEFFFTVQGLPYGYHNFLFGWIDTARDNFPCLPPDYKLCLSAELVEIAAGTVDRLDKAIANQMYNQAFTHRVGVDWGTLNTTADILMYAREKQNLNFTDLIQIVERDEWVYSDGKSMVCDVFVCSTWKAAGLFGDLPIECTELTPTDVERLNFFDASGNRPDACVQADPTLPYCQLNGVYRLDLPGYNTIAPYANYAQKCPGIPPNYDRPSDC